MIKIEKLAFLPENQRRRKIILCLDTIEKSFQNLDCLLVDFKEIRETVFYLIEIFNLIIKDSKLSTGALEDLISLKGKLKDIEDSISENNPETNLDSFIESVRRIVNSARHHLLKVTGVLPAEWDLIVPERVKSGCFIPEVAFKGNSHGRFYYPELFVYAEDIRSPFNIGSIFRTAEAFGAEKVILSPFCASPEHPRAKRSSMGTIDIIPWEQEKLDTWLEKYNSGKENPLPVIALETGGTDINNFVFPKRGIVILGSEELGIQPETLEMAYTGRVTIPLPGAKASLNVGVAFGILMGKWTEQLAKLKS